MRRFAIGIVFCLVLVPASAFAQIAPGYKLNSGQCVSLDARTVKHLGPTRSQGFLGMCYGFTAAMALEQAICKKRGKVCGEEDQVAVLDLLQAEKSGEIAELGHASIAILKAMQQGKVAKESCAPYEQLIQKSGKSNWNDFAALYMKSLMSPSNKVRCETAAELKAIGNLTQSLDEIVSALARQKNFGQLLADILVPQSCRESGIDTSQLQSMNGFAADDELSLASIRKVVGGLVRKDTPVIWNYCAGSTGEKCDSRHSVLIIGTRTQCCGSGGGSMTCALQYEVRDPWPEKGNDPHKSRFVDEQEVLRLTQEAGEESSAEFTLPDGSKKRLTAFQWIVD